jgi:phage FluMu protein Com
MTEESVVRCPCCGTAMQVIETTQEYVQLKCPVCELRDTRLR